MGAGTRSLLIHIRQTEIPMSTATRAAGTKARHETDPEAPATSAVRAPAVSEASAQASAQAIEAERTALLRHALRMLPRSALDSVVTASCSWYAALPPAARRQCLAALEQARLGDGDGDVDEVLDQWRARAAAFVD